LFSLIPIVSGVYLKYPPEPLVEFGIKSKPILLSAITQVLIGLPVVTGILLVQSAAKDKLRTMKRGEDYVRWFSEKMELLQKFLLVAGTVLGLGILASGALSRLYIAFGYYFHPYIVLIYGAFLTLLLAIIYIPAHSSLVALGNHLLDMKFKLPSPSSDSWIEVISKRKSLEELLQLRIGAGQNIRSNIAIVAPLISGIISTLLGQPNNLGI
jgi:hypothetical protein